MTNHRADAAVARLAAHQHGVFSRAQARQAGFTADQVDRRVATGRWLAMDTAVYALPGNAPTWHRQLKAAELSAATAVISGTAAAAMHHFDGYRPVRPEITVAFGRNSRSKLARVRRSRNPVPALSRSGIRVTTPARTFLDVAQTSEPGRARAALEDAAVRKMVDPNHLGDLCVDSGRSHPRGIRVLRPTLALLVGEEQPLDSVLELRLHEVLAEAQVPGIVKQGPLPWWPQAPRRVDITVPVLRMIIEADGRLWHARLSSFDRDRWRDNQATLHGWGVLRFTWRFLTQGRADVLRDLRRLAAVARTRMA